MELLGIAEVAKHLGVSPRRVRHLLADGQVNGRMVGRQWLVDPSSIPAVPRGAGQPLSPRLAWALIAIADGAPPSGLSPSEASRLRRRWREYQAEGLPLPRLRTLLARRAQRKLYSAPDPADTLADARLAPSGRSDPRSGMVDHRLAEGYVATDELDGLVLDNLLIATEPGEQSNVVLYVAPSAVQAPVPWLLVAADLADGGARETQQATHLIRSELRR